MLNEIFIKLKSLNSNKYFAGIVMIMLNIGSKYITIKLSKTQKNYLQSDIARQILIFSIIWMGTKDIFISLTLTAVFYVLTNHLFNEESKMCVLPQNWREIHKSLDTNNDGKVSKQEIDNALKILEKARRETFLSSLKKK